MSIALQIDKPKFFTTDRKTEKADRIGRKVKLEKWKKKISILSPEFPQKRKRMKDKYTVLGTHKKAHSIKLLLIPFIFGLLLILMIFTDTMFPNYIVEIESNMNELSILKAMLQIVYPALEKQVLQLKNNGYEYLIAPYKLAVDFAFLFFIFDLIFTLAHKRTVKEELYDWLKKECEKDTFIIAIRIVLTNLLVFGLVYYFLDYRLFDFNRPSRLLSADCWGIFFNSFLIFAILKASIYFIWQLIFLILIIKEHKACGSK